MLEPAGADFRFPESRFKLSPVCLVGLFDVSLDLKQFLKNEVLDQIRSGELGAASIEGLEDLLSVLVRGKVDNNQLDQFSRAPLDCIRPAPVLFRSLCIQPGPGLIREESVGIDQPR